MAERAALYARVSTDRQAERYGLEAQRQALRRRAAERGYEIVPDGQAPCFTDDGYSGGELSRPALNRLREAVRDGRVDVVLCFDPDRLSRSLRDQLLLADEFEGAGVRLEFLTQEMDASPEGKLFFAIRGAVAEYEKAKIKERMMRGKREKARQGQVVNPAKLPAWLRSPDGGKTVELDPHWAEVARLIWRLFLEEGLSLRQVARRLTELGYRTPSGGTHWQPTTVQAWLRNPAAKGEFCQFRWRVTVPKQRRKPVAATARRRPESSQVERPPEEWLPVPVPPLVDPATWQAAQRRLDENQRRARRNAHHFYLLSGLLVCGACGRRLVGLYKTVTGRRYYQCSGRGKPRRVDGSGVCRMPYVNADRMEQLVWERISALLQDPDLLEAELVRRRERGSPTRENLETQLRQAQVRLGEIPVEMDRLVEGYGKGLIPDELMSPRMKSLREERDALVRRVEGLESELEALEQAAERAEGALAFARRVAEGLANCTDEERQRLLRILVDSVVVHPDRIVVNAVFPVDDGPQGSKAGLCQLRTNPPQAMASDSEGLWEGDRPVEVTEYAELVAG